MTNAVANLDASVAQARPAGERSQAAPCLDTSVLIAATCPWHPRHADASRHLAGMPGVASHCLVEFYATVTRLPREFRIAPQAAAAMVDALDVELLAPPVAGLRELPGELAALGISGGATYDGLIARTAIAHGRRLLSLDRRAAQTYAALGAPFDLL